MAELNQPISRKNYFPEDLNLEKRLKVLQAQEICLMGHYINTDNVLSSDLARIEKQLQTIRRQKKYCTMLIEK